MTTIQDNFVPKSVPDATKSGKAAAKSGAEEAQDRFMTLLVTQMKNQDPLNPLDNAQVTSQLAQLSTVTGIDKLNSTLESLMGSYQTSQSLQAASMIGHGVLVPGTSVDLIDGKALMGVELNEPVDNMQVTVRDATGKEVRTIDLGPRNVGTVTVPWDGKDADGKVAANGEYTFEVAATRGNDKVTATPLQFGMVATVEMGAQGVKLNLLGMGTVSFADVRQIL